MPRRIDYDKVLNDVTSAWGGVLDMIGPAPPAVAQEQFTPLPSPFEDVLRWHENPSSLMPYIGQNSPMVDPVMPYTRWLDAGPPSISPGPLDRMAGPSATIRGLMQQGAASRGAASPSMTIAKLQAADQARRAGTPPGSGSPKVDDWQAPSPNDGGQRSSSGAVSLTTPVGNSGGYAVRDTVTRWLPLVEEMSAKHGVPVEVILASIDSESGGDPKAIGPVTDYGHAYGLLQGLSKYWGTPEQLHDPAYNLNTIVGQLMKPAWDKFHSAAAVRAVTYGGPKAVEPDGTIHTEWGDSGINGWTIGKDVQRYLPKVAAYQAWYAANRAPAPAPSGSPGQAQMMQAQAAPSGKASGWNFFGGQRYPLTGGFRDTSAGYPSSGHRGLDLGAPMGAAVTAPTTATVVHAGPLDGGYGNAVVLQLPTGHKIILGHLSSVAAQVGQQVQAGAALGNVGSTGKSSGPHLHVEISDAQNNLIDPHDIFDFA